MKRKWQTGTTDEYTSSAFCLKPTDSCNTQCSLEKQCEACKASDGQVHKKHMGLQIEQDDHGRVQRVRDASCDFGTKGYTCTNSKLLNVGASTLDGKALVHAP